MLINAEPALQREQSIDERHGSPLPPIGQAQPTQVQRHHGNQGYHGNQAYHGNQRESQFATSQSVSVEYNRGVAPSQAIGSEPATGIDLPNCPIVVVMGKYVNNISYIFPWYANIKLSKKSKLYLFIT